MWMHTNGHAQAAHFFYGRALEVLAHEEADAPELLPVRALAVGLAVPTTRLWNSGV